MVPGPLCLLAWVWAWAEEWDPFLSVLVLHVTLRTVEVINRNFPQKSAGRKIGISVAN